MGQKSSLSKPTLYVSSVPMPENWQRCDRERVSELLHLLLSLPPEKAGAAGSQTKHRGTAGETAAATSASEVNRATPQKKSTIAMLVSAEDRPQLGRLTAK